jgi:hypothetical protein
MLVVIVVSGESVRPSVRFLNMESVTPKAAVANSSILDDDRLSREERRED